MAIQVQGNGGVVAEVEDSTTRAIRAALKPYGYSTLGHYRASFNVLSVAAQTAASRIAVLRNAGSNLFVVTRCKLRAVQVAAGTAQENALDAYKLTGFTVLDTTNTVTVTPEVMRTTGMSSPTNAQIRVSNAAAGMTGGTSTTGQMIGSLPYNIAAAINTTTIWGPEELTGTQAGEHPLILQANEGLLLANRTLNVTSYGIRWYVDLAFAEVASF